MASKDKGKKKEKKYTISQTDREALKIYLSLCNTYGFIVNTVCRIYSQHLGFIPNHEKYLGSIHQPSVMIDIKFHTSVLRGLMDKIIKLIRKHKIFDMILLPNMSLSEQMVVSHLFAMEILYKFNILTAEDYHLTFRNHSNKLFFILNLIFDEKWLQFTDVFAYGKKNNPVVFITKPFNASDTSMSLSDAFFIR